MEEVLRLIAAQNEQMLSALESISHKLDVLDDIRSAANSIDSALGSIDSALGSIDSTLTSTGFTVGTIGEELHWHKNLSFASQLIEAVDNVRTAIELRD